MTNEVMDAPISEAEIEAVKAQLLASGALNIEDLKNKNSAVLTTMLPPALSFMLEEAAKTAGSDGGDIGKAAYVRNLIAEHFGYALPVGAQKESRKQDKRAVAVKAAATRSAVADLIARARAGEVQL